MSYTCCSYQFYNITSYVKHLQNHKENKSLLVKCNECGNTSTSWKAFKAHVDKNHLKIPYINEILPPTNETAGIDSFAEEYYTQEKEINSFETENPVKDQDPLIEVILQQSK